MKPPTSNTPNFPPLEDGLQKARCYLMAYVGTQEDDFKGNVTMRPKVVIGFLYPEHTFDFKGQGVQEPYSKSITYTFNLGRKANLRKDLETWRGKKWSEDWPDFEIDKVLGAAVMHNIIHNEEGTRFYIDSFIKIKNQDDCPPLEIEPVKYDIREHDEEQFQRLPQWVQQMAKDSPDWIGSDEDTDPPTEEERLNAEMAYAGSEEEEEDSEIPF